MSAGGTTPRAGAGVVRFLPLDCHLPSPPGTKLAFVRFYHVQKGPGIRWEPKGREDCEERQALPGGLGSRQQSQASYLALAPAPGCETEELRF